MFLWDARTFCSLGFVWHARCQVRACAHASAPLPRAAREPKVVPKPGKSVGKRVAGKLVFGHGLGHRVSGRGPMVWLFWQLWASNHSLSAMGGSRPSWLIGFRLLDSKFQTSHVAKGKKDDGTRSESPGMSVHPKQHVRSCLRNASEGTPAFGCSCAALNLSTRAWSRPSFPFLRLGFPCNPLETTQTAPCFFLGYSWV